MKFKVIVWLMLEVNILLAQDGPSKSTIVVPKRIAERECQKILEHPFPAPAYHTIRVSASLGELPHVVALGYDRGDGYMFDCGGFVVSKNYVLTAAHCTATLDSIEPTIVRTSVVEINGKTWDAKTDVTIAEIIIHPDWSRKLKYHDLALLRLNKSLSFSSNLNAVCLETSNEDPTLPLFVTGWGRTSSTRDEKIMLLKTSVTAVPTSECSESYTNWRKLSQGIVESQLCAVETEESYLDRGTGGSPLQSVSSENRYRVVGIASFGRGYGSAVPDVYTRVSKYVDWIESFVWPQH